MKKIKILTMAAVLFAAGTFFFSNATVAKADVTDVTRIEEGVYISGINVGGMTAEEATSAVNTYVEGLKETWITLVGPKNTLKYQLKDLGLSANTEEAVKEAVKIGNTGNLITRFKDLEDLEKEDHVIDMGLGIDKQLTGNKIHSKRSKIDIKAIDNGVKKQGSRFVYYTGQEGNEVDIISSVNALNESIGTEWEIAPKEKAEFLLTSIISQPKGAEADWAVVKNILGTHSTNYGAVSSPERATNIQVGTKKVNGAILYPGQEFSFYEYVTPFTAENGYELAGAFSAGDTVESYGGGICQVVTTLYNAVLKAELEITQRFNHSMIVVYADPAADAAIAGTYKDLRFKNNYDFPIYIEGLYDGVNVTFNVYGQETRPSNRKVSYVSKILNTNDPVTEFTFSSQHPVGTFIETRAEHIGYTAELWKVVTVDGKETEKTRVNKSYYKVSCRKVTIGTAGATQEQLNAISAAIRTNDDAVVQATVEGFIKPPAPAPAPVPPVQTPETGDGGNQDGGNETPDLEEGKKEETNPTGEASN